MKDPDVLWDAILDAVHNEPMPGLDQEEKEAVAEKRKSKVRELCNKWFEYGEYLTVEIDTEAGTCTVIEI